MKKIITMIAMAIAFVIPLSAQTSQEVLVGDESSTETSKTPIEFFYNNSYSQVIYLSSELQAGLITEISYYQQNPSINGSYPSQIYMGETNQSNFTDGVSTVDAIPVSDLTLVYDGTQTFQQGWVTITLTTPFNYTGTGNLVVAYLSNRGYYADTEGVYDGIFKGTLTSDNKAFVAYHDSHSANPSNLSQLTKAALAVRPNTRFLIIPESEDYCYPVSNLTVSDITAEGATISWTANNASAFYIEYKLASEDTWTLAADNFTSFSGTFTGLSSSQDFDVRVASICENAVISSYREVSFRTNPSESDIISAPYEQNFNDLTNVSEWRFSNGTNGWYIGEVANNAELGSLYVSGDDGATNSYIESETSSSYAYTYINFPEGDNYALSFDWIGEAEGYYYDYLQVFLLPLNHIFTSNTAPLPTNGALTDRLYGATEWQNALVSIPDTCVGNSYMLAFAWRNDVSVNPTPAPAIDNIRVFNVITTIEATICQGEDYTENNFAIYNAQESGVHSITTQSGDVTILNLTVNPVEDILLTDTVCFGAAYTDGEYFNIAYSATEAENAYSTAGVHTYTWEGQTAAGCQKTVTLELTVEEKVVVPITGEVCFGGTYTDENNVFNLAYSDMAGVENTYNCEESGAVLPFSKEVVDANGCITKYDLTLTVLPIVQTEAVEASVCVGAGYVNDELAFNLTAEETQASGVHYSVVRDNETGCYTKHTLNLTVYPEEHTELIPEAAICFGSSYTDNQYFSISYSETATTPVMEEGVLVATYNTWGENVFVWEGQTENGCEKTVTLKLNVNEPFLQTFSATICEGESYNAQGFNIEEATMADNKTHYLYYANADGCLTGFELELTVNPIHHIYENPCQGSDYTYEDVDNNFTKEYTNIQESGDDTFMYETENGCKKVTVHFTVRPVEDGVENVAVCQGSDYTFEDADNGFTHTFTNLQANFDTTLTYVTANGCERTVAFNITVNPKETETINATVCQGDDYLENGFALYDLQESGTHTLLSQTEFGCEKRLVLNLTVNPVEHTTANATVCYGGTYTDEYFNITYSEDGYTSVMTEGVLVGTYNADGDNVYRWEGQTENGCEKTVTLTLNVEPIKDTTIEDYICWGAPYSGNGFEITYDETLEEGYYRPGPEGQYGYPGYYYDYERLETDENGCMRIVTLHLGVRWLDEYSVSETICYGNSYTENGFNITFDPTAGNTYSSETGVGTYAEAGTYEFVIDETVDYGPCTRRILTLTVNPMIEINYAATVCQGSGYTENGFNLTAEQTQESGEHRIPVTMNGGCLAEAVLDLTVVPFNNEKFTDAICFGSDYEANGFKIEFSETAAAYSEATGEGTYIAEGEYTFVREYDRGAEFGISCIELDTLVLTVNPILTETIEATICLGGSVSNEYFEITYSAEGANTSDASGEGTYNEETEEAVYVRRVTEEGCLKEVTLNLTVNPVTEVVTNAAICLGDNYSDEYFNVTFTDEYSSENGTGTYAIADTTYQYIIEETVENSCTRRVLNLTVNPTEAITIDAEVCQGADYTENGFNLVNVQESGVHKLNTRTDAGCSKIVTLNLTVKPVYTTNIAATICTGSDYAENGFELTDVQQSGIHSLSYTAANGCDSIITLNLTVVDAFTTELYATICQGSDYVENGFNLTDVQTSGIFADTLQAVSGCDSIVTLHLTVSDVVTNDIYATVCQGSDYVDNGFEVLNAQESDVYTRSEQSEEGCTITTNLYLTVNPVVVEEIAATVCQGSDYTENGFNLTNVQESGVHTLNLTTAEGCAKTVNLTLTVNPTFATALEATVCQGANYTENGFNILNAQESGVYTQNLTSANGCDSSVALTLTVNPVENETIAATVCQGSDYVENGFNILNAQESGVYTLETENANGCTSVVTLNLTVRPAYSINLAATVCQGSDYTENGFNLTNVQESGVYTLDLDAVNGCDSIVALNLTVKPVEDETINAIVCQGGDYTENGFELYNVQTSGVHTMNVQTANGCTKVVTLNLTVLPAQTSTITATVCQGSDYTENGFNILNVQESGVYTVENETANGCASTLTLNLTVRPVYSINFAATVCQGSDYVENGFNLTNVQESGVHTLNLQSANGCDSTVTLTLTVNPVENENLTATVCQGGDYTENGFELYNVQTSGVHTMNVQTANGCTKVVTLNLTVLPAQTSTITATVCQGSDYTENGFNILNAQESGVYTSETETDNGCTSVVTLNLTVRPTYSINFAATVCQGSDYVENGFNLTNVQESGVHTLNLQSANGCDSTVTLTLTVNPVENENVTATVCQGGDYTENGFELYNVQESGVHTINVQTANGCVKTVTLNLTVVPAYTINLSATICQGGNYTDNGFNLTNVQESGVHTLNLTTANGCDSIVTLNLNVLLAYSINIEATVNQGENYTANGFNITNVQENGVYTQTLTAANGCDSVIVLNLTVNVGLEDAVSAEALSAILYPNPAENFTTLKIENLTSEAEVIVFDIQGRAIIRQTVQAGESEIRFDLTNVEAGTYSVRIMTKEDMTTRKLIRR